MGSDWREKSPIHRIERYLWRRFNKYPDYDWRDPNAYPKPDSLHAYYQNGWELVNHLEMLLFASGASFGCTWPFAIEGQLTGTRLFVGSCSVENCAFPINAIIDGVFYCHDHGYEKWTGKKYIPPTLEEMRRHSALSLAMERMYRDEPRQSSLFLMDEPYLERLAELSEEEYRTLCNKKPN